MPGYPSGTPMTRDELIEKMLDAYERELQSCKSDSCVEGMSSVLDVAKEELLREPTEREIDQTADYPKTNWSNDADHLRVQRIFTNRRAQLDKVKTLEERI